MCIVVVLCQFNPVYPRAGRSYYPNWSGRSTPEPAPPYDGYVVDSVELVAQDGFVSSQMLDVGF